MKLLIILSIFISSLQSDYCNGFFLGYKNGYCYGDNFCIEPIPPLCPLREYWEANDFKSGYHKGFLQGTNDRQSENNYYIETEEEPE